MLHADAFQQQNGTDAVAHSALNTDLHNDIREAVLNAYNHEFNAGKPVDAFLVEAIVSEIGKVANQPDDADPRADAFDAIETERVYQDAGFGNAANTATGRGPGVPMSPGECLFTMEKILSEARDEWYKPQSLDTVAHLVRKIGGVAVQFMERYGAPKREFTEAQQASLAVTSHVNELFERIFPR